MHFEAKLGTRSETNKFPGENLEEEEELVERQGYGGYGGQSVCSKKKSWEIGKFRNAGIKVK